MSKLENSCWLTPPHPPDRVPGPGGLGANQVQMVQEDKTAKKNNQKICKSCKESIFNPASELCGPFSIHLPCLGSSLHLPRQNIHCRPATPFGGGLHSRRRGEAQDWEKAGGQLAGWLVGSPLASATPCLGLLNTQVLATSLACWTRAAGPRYTPWGGRGRAGTPDCQRTQNDLTK